MKYLLDTHTFLWYVNNDNKLSETSKNIIANQENSIFLSIASIWEIAIKVSLNKLKIPLPLTSFVHTQLNDNDISLLHISVEHTDKVTELPFHHRDPFDRLIIAQFIVENMPIIGNDTLFDNYMIRRIW